MVHRNVLATDRALSPAANRRIAPLRRDSLSFSLRLNLAPQALTAILPSFARFPSAFEPRRTYRGTR